METPREDDIITNSDESERLPDENPEPLEGMKKEERDIVVLNPEEKKQEKKEEVITNKDAAGTNSKDDRPETGADDGSPEAL